MAATIGSLNVSPEILGQMAAMCGIGGTVGAIIARRIAVTDLPQLVALFHSFVGLAAVLTAYSKYLIDIDVFATDPAGQVHKAAIFAGTFIGGITFTGSLTAFGKLQGLLDSNPLSLPGKNYLNAGMALANVGALAYYMKTNDLTPGMATLGKFSLGLKVYNIDIYNVHPVSAVNSSNHFTKDPRMNYVASVTLSSIGQNLVLYTVCAQKSNKIEVPIFLVSEWTKPYHVPFAKTSCALLCCGCESNITFFERSTLKPCVNVLCECAISALNQYVFR